MQDNERKMDLKYFNDKKKDAFNNVSGRDAKIDEWVLDYEAESTQTDDRLPNLKVKDIRNYIRTATARATNIFMQNQELCRCTPTKINTRDKASNMSKILNYQFNNEFDKYNFLQGSIKKHLKEGSCVVTTGWEYESEVIEDSVEYIDIPEKQYNDTLAQIEVGTDRTVLEKGEYDEDAKVYKDVKIGMLNVIKDRPIAVIKNIKDIALDPASTGIKDARFIIEKMDMTLSDIRKLDKEYNQKAGIFENTDELIKQLEKKDNKELRDTFRTGSGVDTREEEYDFNETYLKKNPNKTVTIYKYTGEYDIDEDGRNEEVIAYFTDDVLLGISENDMPVKRPYIKVDFDKEALEKYGNALAEFVGGTQKIRTALVRYIIAAAAMGVYRQTIYSKDAINDPYEERKLEENILGGVVGVSGRASDAVFERESPPLRQDLFNALQIAENEGQTSAGIGKYPVSSGADSATEANIIANQSETLFMDMFNNIKENLLKPLFKQWIKWNNEFLDTKTIVDVLGQRDGIEFMKKDFVGQYDVDIVVSTQGITNQKVNQLTMVMQQMAPLIEQGVLERSDVIEVFAKLNEYWGHKDISQKIRQRQETLESKEVQNKVKQMAMQLGQQLAQQKLQQLLTSNEFKDMVNKMVAEEKEEDFVEMFRRELVKNHFKNQGNQGNQGGNQ